MGATQWISVLLSGVCGAALTQGVTVFLARSSLRKEGEITALLLALTLEEYASRCASCVMENENLNQRGANPDETHTSLPKLADFPEKTNWRSIGATLTERTLQIKVLIANASNEISADWETGGTIVASDTTDAKCLEVGVEALNTAEDLRRAFKLTAMPVTGEWSLRDYLHDGLARQRARKAAWRKKVAEDPDGIG